MQSNWMQALNCRGSSCSLGATSFHYSTHLIDSIEKMITCYFLSAKIESDPGRFFCVRDQKLTPYLDALSRCKNCYFTWFHSNEVALVCDVVLEQVFLAKAALSRGGGASHHHAPSLV